MTIKQCKNFVHTDFIFKKNVTQDEPLQLWGESLLAVEDLEHMPHTCPTKGKEVTETFLNFT